MCGLLTIFTSKKARNKLLFTQPRNKLQQLLFSTTLRTRLGTIPLTKLSWIEKIYVSYISDLTRKVIFLWKQWIIRWNFVGVLWKGSWRWWLQSKEGYFRNCSFGQNRIAFILFLHRNQSKISFARYLTPMEKYSLRLEEFSFICKRNSFTDIRGRSDKYLASPPGGATIAREINCRAVHSRRWLLSKFQSNRTRSFVLNACGNGRVWGFYKKWKKSNIDRWSDSCF